MMLFKAIHSFIALFATAMFQSLPIANAPVGADWTDQRDPVTVVVDRSRRVVLRTLSEEVALVRQRVFHDIL